MTFLPASTPKTLMKKVPEVKIPYMAVFSSLILDLES